MPGTVTPGRIQLLRRFHLERKGHEPVKNAWLGKGEEKGPNLVAGDPAAKLPALGSSIGEGVRKWRRPRSLCGTVTGYTW